VSTVCSFPFSKKTVSRELVDIAREVVLCSPRRSYFEGQTISMQAHALLNRSFYFSYYYYFSDGIEGRAFSAACDEEQM